MDFFFYSEIVIKILVSILMGLICGLFSYFLDYCFWPSSIFKKWLPWLSKTLVRKFRKHEFDLISRLPIDSQEQEFMSTASEIFIYKPLGGCAVCMNVYIAAFTYALIWVFVGLEWPYFFAYVFTSSAVLRKLVKATY